MLTNFDSAELLGNYTQVKTCITKEKRILCVIMVQCYAINRNANLNHDLLMKNGRLGRKI